MGLNRTQFIDAIRRTLLRPDVIVVAGLVGVLLVCDWSMVDFWQTRDQKAQRLEDSGDLEAASELYTEPMRRGIALYKDAQFKAAASEFGRVATPDGSYNRGNALLMQGKYDAAVASYDQAILERPDWREAEENRDLALARKKMLEPPEDDGGGTGGMLEADDVVFDDRGKQGQDSQEEVEVGQGDALTDAQLRDLWLKKVETKPADFLRAKFAYQHSRDESEAQP